MNDPLQQGHAAFQAQRWAEAARHYTLAAADNPGDLGLRILLGHALKESGAVQEAMLAYAAAQELPEGILQLGQIAKNNGKIAAGMACFERLFGDPQWDEEARREHLALALYHLLPELPGERQPALAEAALRSGEAITPDPAWPFFVLDLPPVDHPLCILLEADGAAPRVHLDEGRGWFQHNAWYPMHGSGPCRLVVTDPVAIRRIRVDQAPGLRIQLSHAMPQPSRQPRRPELILPLESSDYRRGMAETVPGFGLRHIGRASPASIAVVQSGQTLTAKAGPADWVLHLPPGHILHPDAMAVLSDAIAAAPGAELFYSDELLLDPETGRPTPLCKPAINPVLLEECDYIGPVILLRRALWEGLGDAPGLALRALRQIGAPRIRHIPFPVVARLASPAPPLAAPRILAAPDDTPVTAIIPSRDQAAMLARCLDGLLSGTRHRALRVVVVDNASAEPAALRLLREQTAAGRITLVRAPEKFNFARMINRGAAAAPTGHLLPLNNDIEIIEPHWLEEMLACLALPGTGVVGAKLLYPDRTIQHAGVIIGLGGSSMHWHAGLPGDAPGEDGRLRFRQNLSAVTGACMLISRQCWTATGRFDESRYPVGFNDLDFCLRAAQHGFRTVWTPHATLIHHESITRRRDDAPAERTRWRRELAAFQAQWNTLDWEDPAFSPWFSRREGVPRACRLPRDFNPR